MANALLEHPNLTPVHAPRVSWGGVFAGLFSGLGVFLMLLLIGLAVGFSTFNPNAATGWSGLVQGVGIWGLIDAIVAAFVGGWVASRLVTNPSRTVGALHGLTVWGLMLLVAAWAGLRVTAGTVKTASSLVGGATGAAVSVLGSGASNAGAAAAGLDLDTITNQVNSYLKSQDMPAIPPAQLKSALQSIETQTLAQLRQGQSLDAALNQRTIARALSQRTNLSGAQAQAVAGQLVQFFRQAGDQLQQAAGQVQQTAQAALDATVSAAIPTAWGLWACSIIMMFAALLGGAQAARRRDEIEEPLPPERRVPKLEPREV